MLLAVMNRSKDENPGWRVALKKLRQIVETLLDSKVEIQKDHVRPRQALIREGFCCCLCFPENGHTRTVLEQHSKTRSNDGVVLDDGDCYGRGLRLGFLLGLGGETYCFHGARFIPINAAICNTQK